MPVNISPRFNPTAIPDDELYLRGVIPKDSKITGWEPHSNTDPADAIDVYRIEQRQRVAAGSGLVASRALVTGSLGDVENFPLADHLLSTHDKRHAGEGTPFISFSANPANVAQSLILKHGFGLKDGSDSVVVKARVHPSRILSGGLGKEEVLLVGGLAPSEYVTAQEIGEFVDEHAEKDSQITVAGMNGETLPASEALAHWETKRQEAARVN